MKSDMKSNDLYFYGNRAELELYGSRGLYYQEFYYLPEIVPLFLICLSHCAARNLLSISCTQNNLSIYFKLCGFLSEQVISYLACFLKACTSSITLSRDQKLFSSKRTIHLHVLHLHSHSLSCLAQSLESMTLMSCPPLSLQSDTCILEWNEVT